MTKTLLVILKMTEFEEFSDFCLLIYNWIDFAKTDWIIIVLILIFRRRKNRRGKTGSSVVD